MIPILLIALIAAADLCIKGEIEARDDSEFPRELEGTKGWITLHKSHNTGFPFEVLKSRPDLVKMIPIVIISALGGVLGFLLPKKGYRMEKLVLILTLGGAFSNLYDRITRNYVVDYFSINAGRLKKVIFNLGDFFVFAGAALMVISQIVWEVCRVAKGLWKSRASK
ncbi:MAG: signal peptidase II [Lachnospiraceae bacterium]|jgi:signal peptidase II|nr:signal peptidase II [Lachnospiraceae bacterium]